MKRQSFHRGIAIGPILFIVAILAVLVGAMAAGNNGFSGASGETTKTRGTPLVQQGVNIKMATETLMTDGATEDQIIVSSDFTSPNSKLALFSPDGGTIIPQLPPREAIAASATWVFAINQDMQGAGAAGNNDVVAFIKVANAATCKALNELVFGVNSAQSVTLPTITVTVVGAAVTAEDGVIDAGNVFATNGVTALTGRLQGCVVDSESTPNYWYYQVLRAN